MKLSILLLFVFVTLVQVCSAEQSKTVLDTVITNAGEQEVINLSKAKWVWMSEKRVDTLSALFHEKAVLVHMGGTMNKDQELNVIKTGGIHYKHAEIQESSIQFIDNTAILLNKIRLVAVVGGNEVINPFVVTEVYIRQDGKWLLGSMSFTRLLNG